MNDYIMMMVVMMMMGTSSLYIRMKKSKYISSDWTALLPHTAASGKKANFHSAKFSTLLLHAYWPILNNPFSLSPTPFFRCFIVSSTRSSLRSHAPPSTQSDLPTPLFFSFHSAQLHSITVCSKLLQHQQCNSGNLRQCTPLTQQTNKYCKRSFMKNAALLFGYI